MTENIEYTNIKGTAHHCQRCGWNWVSKLGRPPRTCPRCKSYDWQKPRKEEVKDHE